MNKNKLFIGFLSLALLAGCGPTSNPTTAPSTGPTEAPTSAPTEAPTTDAPTEVPTSAPTTTGPIEYVDLATAVENTQKGYQLYSIGLSSVSKSLIEFNVPNLYGYTYNGIGYTILEEDPKFTHPFDIKRVYEDDSYHLELEMFGRIGDSSVYKQAVSQRNVFYYFGDFVGDCVKIEENKYLLQSTSFGYNIKDFFQSNMIKYCNEFEFTIGADGCLEYFFAYEVMQDERAIITKYKFEKAESSNDIEVFNLWRESGSKINVQLADYKNFYQPSRFSEPCSVYEGESVDLDLIVTTSDVDNNLYAATFDERYGYVGIKIAGHGSEYEPQDAINVKGTIKTSNFEVYINEPTITDLGKKGDYLPLYDEEAVEPVYGGGAYAAQLFTANPPLFASSLYKTYAYISSYEERSATADAKISLAFPSFKIDASTVLTIDLVVPAELSSETKDNIYDVVTSSFGLDSLSPTCLEVSNMLIRFDPTSTYYLSFEAVEQTTVRVKPTVTQKIEEMFGYENFPLPVSGGFTSFKFGTRDTMNLETYFLLDETNPTKGLFVEASSVTVENFDAYGVKLVENGFEIIEKTKDIQNKVHNIYQNENNLVVSMCLIEDDYYSSSAYMEMWIYEAETPLMPKLIEQKLEDLVGDYFDMDNFIRYEGTYDADYNIFELPTYAGISYDDNPLICYTVNVDGTSASSDYAKALIKECGFKQYKVNNVPYTYKTRGNPHLLLTDSTGEIFIDLAVYHTSDYTYYGHDEFEYRMEVIIYKGKGPLEVATYDDLSVLTSIHGKYNAELDYASKITLPEGTVVEYWAKKTDYNVDYGYGGRDEVFIYLEAGEEMENVWEQLKTAILEAGYTQSVNKAHRQSFSTIVNGEYLFVAIMKEPEKGYIRLMNDVLGVSFID